MRTFFDYPETIIVRHRRENLKKCSLKGLEERKDFSFFRYPTEEIPRLPHYILLTMNAPYLSNLDSACGLVILDGTWRLAEKMYRTISKQSCMIMRSLPASWKTAYPRRQLDCPEPDRGLASIEAIFAAYSIFGRQTEGLLDNYFWKKEFLIMNKYDVSGNFFFS